MINSNPYITTIIPTFRRPRLLKRAIISAIEQSYTCIRVLVIDNASNDKTFEVVKELMHKDDIK